MREQLVLDVLRKHATSWITRSDLAAGLGRKRLNTLDLQALTSLEITGKIEVERRPDPRPVGFVAYYRIKE